MDAEPGPGKCMRLRDSFTLTWMIESIRWITSATVDQLGSLVGAIRQDLRYSLVCFRILWRVSVVCQGRLRSSLKDRCSAKVLQHRSVNETMQSEMIPQLGWWRSDEK
jgi:hypothetical protein